MKYTNGFFVFRFEHKNKSEQADYLSVYGLWERLGKFETYDMYLYSWVEKDPHGFKRRFEQAPVWIDFIRQNVIIFLRSEHIVKDVVGALEKKFNIVCKPFELTYPSRIQESGEVVILSKGINEISNKVNTSLIKNHIQRASIVESVLSGG